MLDATSSRRTIGELCSKILRDGGLVRQIVQGYQSGMTQRELGEQFILDGNYGITSSTIAKNTVYELLKKPGILSPEERARLAYEHRRDHGQMNGLVSANTKTGVHGRTKEEMADDARRMKVLNGGNRPASWCYDLERGVTEEEDIIALAADPLFQNSNGTPDYSRIADAVNHTYRNTFRRKPRTRKHIRSILEIKLTKPI